MSEESSAVAEYLAEHPRMIGALFTVLALLVQASTAVAGGGSTYAGP